MWDTVLLRIVSWSVRMCAPQERKVPSMQATVTQKLDPWDQIREYLEPNVGRQNFSTWLEPARFSHIEEDVLFVRVPNRTFRDFYSQNFATLFQQALKKLPLGIERIEFVEVSSAAKKSSASSQAAFDFDSPIAQLNPRYTFDTFVVGPSNQFAHAASDAVARNPSKAYNPLFLYGGVGMGKTHLLQAIGHVLGAQRRLRMFYVSANQFVHDMINSIRYDRMVSFHDRYRNLDVLLVDDIQFVSSKERTQEEFFHTFNALYESQKQIVITSDRPPKEIQNLEERLRSRFEWGLMADLQPPDLETKVAILIRKADLQGVALPDDVAMMVASKMPGGNVRELEGALTRLLAYSSLTGAEITTGMAQQVLKGTLRSQERRVNIEAIQQVVAEEFRLRVADLKARNNSRNVVHPRQVAMYLARELAGASLPEIGRAFGGKHHTTVLHSVDKIRTSKSSDKDLNRLIHKLSDSLR
jgi:chromosomal replication initiator protein